MVKGTQMRPLLALVSLCFRENVNVTCKIVSFLCSLDNFLLKNVIVFFVENDISKWHSIEKGAILNYFSHFLVTRETTQKYLQRTYPTYIHISILLTLLTFLPSQFCNNCEFIMYGFSLVWLLVLIFFAPFWSNQ